MRSNLQILHISDLHITESSQVKNLDSLWVAVLDACRKWRKGTSDPKFDFIVVSGDLTVKGQAAEYQQLIHFAKGRLCGLVPDNAPERVIFVPGNHDVDWDAPVFKSLSYLDDLHPDLARTKTLDAIRDYWNDPSQSELRHFVSREGQVHYYRINRRAYRERFANIQEHLLDKFYPKRRGAGLERRFNLLADDGAGDWSLHVFPTEGVLFLGLNSCAVNDRSFAGAGFAQKAMRAAAEAVGKWTRQGIVPIAVWHHGLESNPGGVDRISLADVGQLVNMGIRVGLHGHVHRSSTQRLMSFSPVLPVFSVGTLGAAKEQRPDAVDNQFAVLELAGSYASQRIFQRESTTTAFRVVEDHSARIPIGREDAGALSSAVAARADRHVRSCRVGPHGIARVMVELEGLRGQGEIPLLDAGPLDLQLDPEQDARCASDAVSQSVQVNGTGAGSRRLTLSANHLSGGVATCTWSYRAANAIAIYADEGPYYRDYYHDREAVRQWANPGSGEDWIPFYHDVCIDSAELVLEIQVSEAAAGAAYEFRPVMYEPRPGTPRMWSQQTANSTDWEFKQTASECRFSIRGPGVGNRYAILYRPLLKRSAFSETSGALTEGIVEHVHKNSRWGRRLKAALLDAIESGITSSLEISKSEITDRNYEEWWWVLYLYTPRTRRLTPVAGCCPTPVLSVSYAYGEGLVGHTFRFLRHTGWTRPATPSERPGPLGVLYREPNREFMSYWPQHDWIGCIPIVDASTDMPLGALGFAGRSGADSPIAERLQALARNHDPVHQTPMKAQWDRLGIGVNHGFLGALISSNGADAPSYFQEFLAAAHICGPGVARNEHT